MCGRRRNVVLGVSLSQSEWFILQMLYGPTFPSTCPFGLYCCCCIFLPVAKHCQSTFFSSLNPFKIHLDANYVCPSVKNLTLSTCLLSFVCDFLNREKVHNILIFAKFLSYSVGEMLGGGGYFLGISTLKQTLTLVILPCEILSKSDLIYQEKNVANSEN